jgi:hypothetical protein
MHQFSWGAVAQLLSQMEVYLSGRQCHARPTGSGLGVYRYVVEQTIALIHQFRRLRPRFDTRDDVHESFNVAGLLDHLLAAAA